MLGLWQYVLFINCQRNGKVPATYPLKKLKQMINHFQCEKQSYPVITNTLLTHPNCFVDILENKHDIVKRDNHTTFLDRGSIIRHTFNFIEVPFKRVYIILKWKQWKLLKRCKFLSVKWVGRTPPTQIKIDLIMCVFIPSASALHYIFKRQMSRNQGQRFWIAVKIVCDIVVKTPTQPQLNSTST